jgi:hypothetical protein
MFLTDSFNFSNFLRKFIFEKIKNFQLEEEFRQCPVSQLLEIKLKLMLVLFLAYFVLGEMSV